MGGRGEAAANGAGKIMNINAGSRKPGKQTKGASASRRHTHATIGMILPLYIFTLLFVACPLLYMVALSFATPGEVHGVQWIFTLDTYRKILEPVYLATFVQSFQ